MRREYDFSNATRGALTRPGRGKSRITIRLDSSIIDWFKERADAAGGGSYQTMINAALREHVARNDGEAGIDDQPIDLMTELERLIARSRSEGPASRRPVGHGRARKGRTPAA